MKIHELKNWREPRESSDEDVTLKVFNDEDDHDEWLAELCDQLLGLENSVQIRMVLKVYLEHMLTDVKWGGTEV